MTEAKFTTPKIKAFAGEPRASDTTEPNLASGKRVEAPRLAPTLAARQALIPHTGPDKRPQSFYDEVKQKFAAARDVRLDHRPPGTEQYTFDVENLLSYNEPDPYAPTITPREALTDEVDVLIIGTGFSGLLTAARLREKGIRNIRMVERGSDVGGTWYWNRYPGVACDTPAYDYLPLLDELKKVPSRFYSKGAEIWAHCQDIARRYDLYDHTLFQTTVTSTVWQRGERRWLVSTNRGDQIRARFVVCANGTLTRPRLSRIEGQQDFEGHSFHTSRWDFDYTGQDLSNLRDKRVGVIGTGATAVQAISQLAKVAKELYVFQRTPSSIDIREDTPTDPEWAANLQPGWQTQRRQQSINGTQQERDARAALSGLPREEKIRRQENANIEYMLRIHRRIEEIVTDPVTAESLKPWYMFMCKRPCFDDEYLPAFNRSNVHLVDTKGRGITNIAPQGPEFDGTIYPLDLLIYATGFEVQKVGVWNKIVGETGVELSEYYTEGGIRTLFGLQTNGYPNLFTTGNYQASFQFNYTFVLQVQGQYIADCIGYALDEGHERLEIDPSREDWWVNEVIKHRGKTGRNQECTPGYYNFEGQFNRRQDGTYNGGFDKYVNFLREASDDLSSQFVSTSSHR